MAIEITIPRLGWSMEEGSFGEWLKAPGEPIQPGEAIYVLEGEKATHEIESIDAGTLCIPPDAPQSGDTVIVGQVIGFLLADGETPVASIAALRSDSGESRVLSPESRDERQKGTCESTVLALDSRLSTLGCPAATPRARRRAKELGIDWKPLSGTGRGGRIRERDVNLAASRTADCAPQEFPPVAPGRHQPASRFRRTIAQRMLAGVLQAAPVTLTTKVDAAGLIALRAGLKAAASAAGRIIPSYTDLIVKLAAAALVEEPRLNACWHRDGVYTFDAVNIAIAVDTQSGLVAPVINDVPRLSLAEIAEQSHALIELARTGALAESQLQGGTFTVTNLGMFDVDSFTPILNLPQAAILGVGRIVREPVIRDDAVVPGETLSLSLTFDHRVIDGAPAARWLQRLSQLIRRPPDSFGGTSS